MINLVVLTNSPGELVGWVKPVINEFKRCVPRSRIYVFVPPCQYASGRESEVIRSWPEVDGVWGLSALLKLILLGIRPGGMELAGQTMVLHLGSDLLYSSLLAKRLRAQAYACTEGYVKCVNGFEKFFVADKPLAEKLLRRGVPETKLAVIGHLFYEAAATVANDVQALRKELDLNETEPVIGIMPGSKPYQLYYDLAFLLKTIELVKARQPRVSFIMAKSPYTDWDVFADALGRERRYALDGVGGSLKFAGAMGSITTENGVSVKIVANQSLNVMRLSRFMLSVPGTNQIEAAVLGVPSVVFIPLNEPEAIPVDGLLHHLPKLPLIGKALKRQLVLKYSAKRPYLTLPNQLAKRMIIPELRGILTPQMVADQVLSLLENPVELERISKELLELTAQPQRPSEKLVQEILRDVV